MTSWHLLDQWSRKEAKIKQRTNLAKLIDDELSAKISGNKHIISIADNPETIYEEGEGSLKELIDLLYSLKEKTRDQYLLGVLLKEDEEFLLVLNSNNNKIGIAKISAKGEEHGHELVGLYSGISGYYYITRLKYLK